MIKKHHTLLLIYENSKEESRKEMRTTIGLTGNDMNDESMEVDYLLSSNR